MTFSWRNTYPTDFKEARNNPAEPKQLPELLVMYTAQFETLPLLPSRSHLFTHCLLSQPLDSLHFETLSRAVSSWYSVFSKPTFIY